MTEKDIKRIQILAESVVKRQDALQLYLGKTDAKTYPTMNIYVDSIFDVQNALGGEIVYEAKDIKGWYDASLEVNGVTYRSVMLTQEMIKDRKGAREYING